MFASRPPARTRRIAAVACASVALIAAGCSDDEPPANTLAPAGTGEGTDRGEVDEPLDDLTGDPSTP